MKKDLDATLLLKKGRPASVSFDIVPFGWSFKRENLPKFYSSLASMFVSPFDEIHNPDISFKWFIFRYMTEHRLYILAL